VPRTACGALGWLALGCLLDAATAAGAPAALRPQAAESLSLELVLPAQVPAGAPVTITLRGRNGTQRPLDLYLRGRTTTFDVVVAEPGGEVVWRRLEGEIIPTIVQLRTLAPGEQFELEAAWDQRTREGSLLEPGEYTARGLLLVEGEPLETPLASFRILAP